MENEKRYKLTVISSMGKIVEINADGCRSDDFKSLLDHVRVMYRHPRDPDYQTSLPRIVDRYNNQEFDIFDPEVCHL